MFLVPVVLVVLASGCILPGGGPAVFTPGTTGKGVVIEQFEPDFREAVSGQPVQFEYLIKNTGSVPAKKCHEKIFGLDEASWGGVPSTCSGEGKYLEPPNPIYGTGGGSYSCVSRGITAPALPPDTSYTYKPLLRVYCDFESRTLTNINLLPLADARRLQNEGKTFTSFTASKTSSPIEITITPKQPIRVVGGSATFPFEVRLTNVGGGQACEKDCEKEDNWNRVSVKLDSDTLALAGGSEKIVTCYKNTAAFTCTATASGISAPKTGTIEATANYQYIVDKTTSITVTGQ